MKCGCWSLALAAVVATAAAVPAAHADPAPAADPAALFLTAVDDAGIEYTDPQEAVALGRQVCDYLQAGHPPNAAARALKISNRSLSTKNAAKFVAFSRTAYCPD